MTGGVGAPRDGALDGALDEAQIFDAVERAYGYDEAIKMLNGREAAVRADVLREVEVAWRKHRNGKAGTVHDCWHGGCSGCFEFERAVRALASGSAT